MIGNMVPWVQAFGCLPLPVVLERFADAWPARAELMSSCNRITSKSLATGFATTLSLRRYHGRILCPRLALARRTRDHSALLTTFCDRRADQVRCLGYPRWRGASSRRGCLGVALLSRRARDRWVCGCIACVCVWHSLVSTSVHRGMLTIERSVDSEVGSPESETVSETEPRARAREVSGGS